MINYIDYYFEAQKEKKTLTTLNIASKEDVFINVKNKESEITIINYNAINFKDKWLDIENLFLTLTGGGFWGSRGGDVKRSNGVETDFESVMENIVSSQKNKERRSFFLNIFKYYNTLPTIAGWIKPELNLLKKEITLYIIYKFLKTKTNLKPPIRKKLEKLLNPLIEASNITDEKTLFKNIDNGKGIKVNMFPHLKTFLSHPYLCKYYDSLIVMFVQNPNSNQTAPYIGYFRGKAILNISNSADSIESAKTINPVLHTVYRNALEKIKKAFITNIYKKPSQEIIATITTWEKEYGYSLPDIAIINTAPAEEILYQLWQLKTSGWDYVDLLLDFLYLYTETGKLKKDPQNAVKQKEILTKEKTKLTERLFKVQNWIDSYSKMLNPNIDIRSKLKDLKIEQQNLKLKINDFEAQLTPYKIIEKGTEEGIGDWIRNQKESPTLVPHDTRKKGVIAGKKDLRMDAGLQDKTKKYKEEIQKAKEDLENLVKKGFREIWNTYQPHLIGNTIENDFDSYWKKIKVEYQKNLEDKFKIPVDLEKLPEPLLNELKEYKKSARESFKDTVDELKQIKTNYDKLLKNQKSHIRKVINDPALGDQYFQKIYNYILQNRRKLSTSDIDAIIVGGLPAEEIQNKIKKDTISKAEKALSSTNIIKLKPAEWAVKFKELIIKDFKNNISKLSVFLSNNIEITEKDFLKGLELEKKVLEDEELDKLRTEGLTTESISLINSILKRHRLQ